VIPDHFDALGIMARFQARNPALQAEPALAGSAGMMRWPAPRKRGKR
jgi:hypothetical protein